MDIVEKSRILTTLIERKMRLQSTLEYMRKEAMLHQVTASFEWKYYDTAADSVEKELAEVLKEIDRIEKE